MDNFGFIHGELDIKILILFILRRLPSPVNAQTLQELCSVDTGIGYFDYAECLAHLVETGHVEEVTSDRYQITEKEGSERADRGVEPTLFRADEGGAAHGADRGGDAQRPHDRGLPHAKRRGVCRKPLAFRREG